MSWITARRRRPVAGYAAVLLGLVTIGAIYAAVTGLGSGIASAASPQASQQQINEGKRLFAVSCSSCHGLGAQGTSRAPSLIGAGAAAVDFQMSTGRMPLKQIDAEAPEKPVTFSQQQIYAIAAYIQSLGGGPAIPSDAEVSTQGADPALGAQLFDANCAQCHNFAGAGGALTGGKYAPPLTNPTKRQIYEAMLTGPEAMPVFGNHTITPQEKRDIIAYVLQTRSEPNPGGFSLGRVGPITEGLVAWLGGIGALVFAAMWITAKRREERTER
ncbi:MAG TPA: c-type cytochrome [Streptosporangiaceae bacterium]|nr:c-type cytochrome [Streptosporangiaceae bacterium]